MAPHSDEDPPSLGEPVLQRPGRAGGPPGGGSAIPRPRGEGGGGSKAGGRVRGGTGGAGVLLDGTPRRWPRALGALHPPRGAARCPGTGCAPGGRGARALLARSSPRAFRLPADRGAGALGARAEIASLEPPPSGRVHRPRSRAGAEDPQPSGDGTAGVGGAGVSAARGSPRAPVEVRCVRIAADWHGLHLPALAAPLGGGVGAEAAAAAAAGSEADFARRRRARTPRPPPGGGGAR